MIIPYYTQLVFSRLKGPLCEKILHTKEILCEFVIFLITDLQRKGSTVLQYKLSEQKKKSEFSARGLKVAIIVENKKISCNI